MQECAKRRFFTGTTQLQTAPAHSGIPLGCVFVGPEGTGGVAALNRPAYGWEPSGFRQFRSPLESEHMGKTVLSSPAVETAYGGSPTG